MSLYFPVASAAPIVRAGFIDGPVDGLHRMHAHSLSVSYSLAPCPLRSTSSWVFSVAAQHYTYPPMRAFIIIAAAIAIATSSLLCTRSSSTNIHQIYIFNTMAS